MPRNIASALSLALLLYTAAPPQAAAQERNTAVLTRMLLDCVASTITPTITPGPGLAVYLPNEAGFAAPDIASAFLAADRTVVLPVDSTNVDSLATLTIRIDDASISYARRGRRTIERTVDLQASYIARESSGVVSASDRCESHETDQLRRSAIDQIEDPEWPLTVGDGPEGTRMGRILTPVVAAAAVVVSAYLLFALRSESGSDP